MYLVPISGMLIPQPPLHLRLVTTVQFSILISRVSLHKKHSSVLLFSTLLTQNRILLSQC